MVKGVLYTTGGTRRSVVALDGKTGEVIWTHSLREGKRAAVSPRQLSGRGVSYWTDGRGDERVVYVTTGYRLVELNAKTGAMISSFGTNGVVDLKAGRRLRQRPADRSRDRRDRRPLDAGHRQGRRSIIGSAIREGATVPTHNNTKGLVRAFDVAHRQAAVDVQHDSAARRVRQRHVGKRIVGGQRQHRRVDADHRRRGARARLPAGRNADVRLLRRPSARATTCSPRAWSRRSEDRPAQVALPVRAPSDLELRQLARRRSCWTSTSTAARSRRWRSPSKQGWLYVFDRVDRPAGVADRRAARCRSPTSRARRRRRRSRSRPSRRPTRATTSRCRTI